MIKGVQASPMVFSPEVSAFAAEQGVSAELPAVVELTRRLFPDATLSVIVEDDPEIANDWHIVIEAKNINMLVSQALEALDEWDRGLFACCPAPLTCVFRLGLEGAR